MQKFSAALVGALAIISMAATSAMAAPARSHADFYVSRFGNDKASGTNAKEPFKTLQRARQAVRQRIAQGLKANLVVQVGGGRYELPDGFAFGPEDGGDAIHSVTWRAVPEETPWLIGGISLRHSDEVGKYIWRYPLPPALSTIPRQVFGNNDRVTLARPGKTGDYFRSAGAVPGQEQTAFQYKPGDLPAKAITPDDDARVFIWPGSNWFSADKPITKVDPETRTVTLGNNDGYPMKAGDRYYPYNALAFLDQPGEAVIRARERAVYLIRPELNFDKTDFFLVTVSTSPPLLAVIGKPEEGKPVRNLHFEGFNFNISNGDVVKFSGAEHCSLRFCGIANGQDRGVNIEGANQYITLYGCNIHDCGWHGVSLTGLGPEKHDLAFPGSGDVSKFNRVENCHIHHCGRLVGAGYGVEISQSGHNQILHNSIHDMPRYGTTIKGLRYQSLREAVKGVTWENHYDFLHGRNNLLAYNDIYNVNQDSQDTGAMESWGPGRDNVYDHNRIHHVGNRQFDLQSGFYLDDATDYFTLTNNIVYDVHGGGGDQPVYVKGIGNRIINNIFVTAPDNKAAMRSLFMADERTDHHEYRRNIFYFDPVPPGGLPGADGAWGRGIGNIHPAGTALSWRISAPTSGNYAVFLRYAADNTGEASPMDNRTTLAVDGRAPVSLINLPNTGGWGTMAWSAGPSAVLPLTKGAHTLTWTNVKGGGLNWDGFVLSNDPNFRPMPTTDAPDLVSSSRLIVVQAEAHLPLPGTVRPRPLYGFDNWSEDRVLASDNNLLFAPDGQIIVDGAPGGSSWQNWRALFDGKFDAHSVIADPQFVNAARRDFRLKPTSPARKLGFQPIDTSGIGLRPDFPKRFQEE